MELYKALETIKNDTNTLNVWIALWDWVIAVVALLLMDFRKLEFTKAC